MKNYVKSCSCNVCKKNKKKKTFYKQANKRLRKTGKPSELMARYREGKNIDVNPVSTGFIG